MIWFGLAVLLAIAIAGGLFVWIRRRRRHRLIAFVALLKEPMTLDPTVLAKVAGKVWNADLGDGGSEGQDGFVVGIGITNTIMHDGRMFLVNSFPTPYVKDVDAAADAIPDLRIRSLFREHAAWFSCDATGVDGTTSDADVLDWYRRLAPLFAELLDDNCLLVFLPDSNLAYPINDDTESALRSPDPLRALQATLTAPIIELSADDPLMKQAVDKARDGWSKFVAAFETRAGENFIIKAPITAGGNTEFIWIAVTAIEGDLIYGTLGNDPGDLGALRLGSKVSAPVADLNDWCYVDARGNMVGGFTLEAMKNAARRRPTT